MEVHHHNHAGHSQSWKEYFLGFFMLFLAVFFGFIAENIREHYVEKSREKEYVQSMIDDLQRDSMQLHMVSKINTKIVKGIDSLLLYLKAGVTEESKKKIYIYSRYVAGSILYENSNGTLSQLKNAGGLRLIKDTAAVNGITLYDQFNELLRKQGQVYYGQTIALIDLLSELMDFSIASLVPTAKATVPKTYFLKNDPDKLRLLYNKCYMQQLIIGAYIRNLDVQYGEAKKLIALLRKHYHFKPTPAADSLAVKDTLHLKDSISPPKK